MWTTLMILTFQILSTHHSRPVIILCTPPMALTWITSMLKIYPSFSHHLLDGNGVCNTASSPLWRRKLGCTMHRQLIHFIACTLPLALNLLCSMTRSAMLTHSGLRPMLVMPFIVLTPLFISMPEIIAWQEMHSLRLNMHI